MRTLSLHRPDTLAPLKRVLGLFKLRIGLVVALTALAGIAVAPGAAPSPWRTAVLFLAVLTCSAAAGAFNQFYEAESDRRMARTRGRAFASGALRRSPGWLLLMAGMLALGFGAAWWAGTLTAAVFSVGGALVYGVVYTVWLKRRTPMNIVVGGLAGAFAVLAGSTAVAPLSSPLPLMLSAVLFLWTPPHFWSLAIAGMDDYRAAGIPMLPVVVGPERAARAVLWSTALLVTASALPLFAGAGGVYAAGAALGGGWFLWKAWKLAATPSRRSALLCFFASLLHLPLLLLAAAVDIGWR